MKIFQIWLCCLLVFICFIPDPSLAEPWNIINPKPTGEHINAFWGSCSSNVFAVGDNGTILHFDGNNWSVMNSNVPYDQCSAHSNPGDLKDVWGASADSVYAVGRCSAVMHYDGYTWSELTAGDPPYASESIWGTSDDNIFVGASAGSNKGKIYHYDGNVWQEVNIPDFGPVYDIYGFSEDNIFAVGDNKGWILHFDGQLWEKMWFGFSEQYSNLQNIWGSSENDLYIGSGATVYHYDGISWKEIDYDFSSFTSIGGSSENDVYVTGRFGDIYHFDGLRWENYQPADLLRYEGFNAVWCSEEGHVFIGGSPGAIYRYDGSRWSRDSQRFLQDPAYWSNENFTGLWGKSSNDVYLTVGYSKVNQIVHFHDGSFSSIATPASESLNDIWGSDYSNIFAVGEMGTIIHYNGKEWISHQSGTNYHLNAVWGITPDNVLAVGDNGIILHYNGEKWTRMTSYTVQDLQDIRGSSGSDIYAVGNGSTVLHFEGSQWRVVGEYDFTNSWGQRQNLMAIWGADPDNIFIAGAYSIFYFNGHKGHRMNAPTGNMSIFRSIWGNSTTDLYAVYTTFGTTRIIHYDGMSWKHLDPYIFENMNVIHGFSENEIFVAGRAGQLFFYGVKPVADFSSDRSGDSFPMNVKFTDQSSSNVYKWLWSFGDGSTSTEPNPTHLYDDAGQYTVELTVWNNAGRDTKRIPNYIAPPQPKKEKMVLTGNEKTIEIAQDKYIVGTGSKETLNIDPNINVDFTAGDDDRVNLPYELEYYEITSMGNNIWFSDATVNKVVTIIVTGTSTVGFADGSTATLEMVFNAGEPPQVHLGGAVVGSTPLNHGEVEF